MLALAADHDPQREPYGRLWRTAYAQIARLYEMPVVGVSGVGPMTAGPWRGRKLIGCSLAVGPDGNVLAEGPYGPHAEALIVVDVEPRRNVPRGTNVAAWLAARGYTGP